MIISNTLIQKPNTEFGDISFIFCIPVTELQLCNVNKKNLHI